MTGRKYENFHWRGDTNTPKQNENENEDKVKMNETTKKIRRSQRHKEN